MHDMHEPWGERPHRRWARRPHRGHGGQGHGGQGHGPGRHRYRGGRSRLGRFFAHGDLRFLILHLIAEKPRHGYEVIKEIEQRLNGAYSPSPGVIYPTLTLLEELGWVQVRETAGAKKLYEITPEGSSALDANRATVDGILARMAEASEDAGGEPAPQIRRAMHNLKTALRMRIARSDIGEEQAKTIAAALDAAAVTIEGS
jgi:DNA-binding PadR family transcriptional regulator